MDRDEKMAVIITGIMVMIITLIWIMTLDSLGWMVVGFIAISAVIACIIETCRPKVVIEIEIEEDEED